MASSLALMQQRLKYLLQSTPELWAYIMFWGKAQDANGGMVLLWEDGHLLEKRAFGDDSLNKSMEDVDVELFYTVSFMQSFTIGKDVIGEVFGTGNPKWLSGFQEKQLFNSERYSHARMYGIQTLVCIPTEKGVLELGSLGMYAENRGLIQQAKSLFAHNVSPPPISLESNAKKQRRRLWVSSSCSNHAFLELTAKRRKPEGRERSPYHVATIHAEDERKRREKMNNLFCSLRAVVPIVSGTDKASLLADAADFIAELNSKISRVKSEILQIKKQHHNKVNFLKLDVKTLGQYAMIGLSCENINHPSTRVMSALQDLDLQVLQANVFNLESVMLHHVVVHLPEGWSKENLKDALISRLE